MSADNGNYVAKFRNGFFVINAQAIDNISYYDEGTPEWIHELQTYFGRGKCFKSELAAVAYAWKLERECPTEYGVSYLGDFNIKIVRPDAIRSRKGRTPRTQTKKAAARGGYAACQQDSSAEDESVS